MKILVSSGLFAFVAMSVLMHSINEMFAILFIVYTIGFVVLFGSQDKSTSIIASSSAFISTAIFSLWYLFAK